MTYSVSEAATEIWKDDIQLEIENDVVWVSLPKYASISVHYESNKVECVEINPQL